MGIRFNCPVWYLNGNVLQKGPWAELRVGELHVEWSYAGESSLRTVEKGAEHARQTQKRKAWPIQGLAPRFPGVVPGGSFLYHQPLAGLSWRSCWAELAELLAALFLPFWAAAGLQGLGRSPIFS